MDAVGVTLAIFGAAILLAGCGYWVAHERWKRRKR